MWDQRQTPSDDWDSTMASLRRVPIEPKDIDLGIFINASMTLDDLILIQKCHELGNMSWLFMDFPQRYTPFNSNVLGKSLLWADIQRLSIRNWKLGCKRTRKSPISCSPRCGQRKCFSIQSRFLCFRLKSALCCQIYNHCFLNMLHCHRRSRIRLGQ